jgi:23S rRNA (uracil1939-C5)-methyltransferase
MLKSGDEVELSIEKAVAGGRMLARHDGQVVLVAGAIPGERVASRIERADRRVAFASTIDVLGGSPDRRPPFPDPVCGGCAYSHIAYERQLALKAEIVRDAYARIGRIAHPAPIPVAASPERGYRMRARFHVRDGRIGFFREGTHAICDPVPSGQVTADAWTRVTTAVARITERGAAAISVELSENIAGDERALAIDVEDLRPLEAGVLDGLVGDALVSGTVVRDRRGARVESGTPFVRDPLSAITGGRVTGGWLGRGPESFFQGNRYLLPALVTAVMDAVPPDATVLDLYAGVGLFSMPLAAAGQASVVAVEGDRASGADLQRNAAGLDRLTVRLERVETALGRIEERIETAIVDPPRTGISDEALAALLRREFRRLVYVSCDPPTMARDARKLLDAGCRLASLQGFDLFPNTPHVEAVGVFERVS